MLDDIQKVVLKESFNKAYDPNEPIIGYYKRINECLKISEYANDVKFTDAQVPQQALYPLRATRLYSDQVEEWKRNIKQKKTWNIFKGF